MLSTLLSTTTTNLYPCIGPGPPPPNTLAPPTTTISSPSFITKIWSTTEITVECPGFFGPTVFSEITTSTITTIGPVATAEVTVVDEVISSITWEYQYYYSDGSSYTSIASGFYTKSRTTVVGTPSVGVLRVGS
jgi:hypothetical protein